MSTASPSRPPAAPSSRPVPGPVSSAGAGPVLDPIKLFKKYQWLLVGASVAGVIFGVVLHVAIMKFYPTYTSEAIFQCFDPQLSPATAQGVSGERDEFERFMATQALVIKSDPVLQKFANDPRLEREAPKWAQQFHENGRYNPAKAIEGIKDTLKVQTLTGTQFIRMSLGWRDKNDTTAVVGLMRQAYLDTLQAQANSTSSRRKDSLQQIIRDLDRDLNTLQSRRRQLITDSSIGSLDQRFNEAQSALNQVNEMGVALRLQLESVRTTLANYEAELNSPAGPNYPDDLRSQVDIDPVMNNARGVLNSLEGELKALQQRGFGPAHREMIALRAQIDGSRAQMEKLRQQLLADRFAALIEGSRQAKASIEAQLLDSEAQSQQLQARLVEITNILTQVQDIDQQITRIVQSRAERQDELNNLQGVDRLDTSARVVTYQTETVPETVSFPLIYITLPLGFLLVVGAVGGLVLLRELMDQRVKGPADIALIPKARLLGMVASTAEDPESPKAVETVFRDSPSSVLSENFRQLASPIIKKMTLAGHKSIVVIGGMPGSGATTIVSNLAFAYATSEHRVLVVDANFRRPALHKVFGRSEGPGLADVLSREKTLEEVIQPAARPGEPDVLTAGTASNRVVERLGANSMSDVLRQAGSMYDIVLIDVAPAVVAGDGLALANRADASVLVVRALAEKRGLVARLRNELSDSRAEFLGVVINAVRSSAGGYFKRNIRATHEYHKPAAAR